MVRILSILLKEEHLMPTPPAVYGQFGPTLAFAERTLTTILREHLAGRDMEPETWYALRLISMRGPGVAREALLRDLERSRELNADSAREAVARLEADGLIRGQAQLELTEEGEAQYRSLREYVTGPTIQLLSQFDIQDIETTVRTLHAITEQAATEAGSPATQ
jgi:DNA-binding MarR family transcriptional regulator